MDDLTTPCLTRSPASPCNTYCASEASSCDYPSPDLVQQRYRLDMTLYTSSSSTSSSAMPSILTAEYDPFGGPYDDSLSGPYSNDVYPGSASDHRHHDNSHSPPPSAVLHGTNSPLPPVKMEESSEYGYGISPHSVQEAPYCTEVSSYPPPPLNGGYYSDGQSTTSWTKPELYPIEPDQLYTAMPGQTYTSPIFSGSSSQQDRRGSTRLSSHPRRSTRKLTTKDEANYQCECGKLFSRSYNYKAHLETHDEKREYNFPCLVNSCDKKFVRKTDLARHHQSVHTKERNHTCEYCSRAFSRRDTLKR